MKLDVYCVKENNAITTLTIKSRADNSMMGGVAELSAMRLQDLDFDFIDRQYFAQKWLFFNRLYVAPSVRKLGLASAMLQKVTELCDFNRLNIVCHIHPYGDLSFEQLSSLYKRHGFQQTAEPSFVYRLFKQ